MKVHGLTLWCHEVPAVSCQDPRLLAKTITDCACHYATTACDNRAKQWQTATDHSSSPQKRRQQQHGSLRRNAPKKSREDICGHNARLINKAKRAPPNNRDCVLSNHKKIINNINNNTNNNPSPNRQSVPRVLKQQTLAVVANLASRPPPSWSSTKRRVLKALDSWYTGPSSETCSHHHSSSTVPVVFTQFGPFSRKRLTVHTDSFSEEFPRKFRGISEAVGVMVGVNDRA